MAGQGYRVPTERENNILAETNTAAARLEELRALMEAIPTPRSITVTASGNGLQYSDSRENHAYGGTVGGAVAQAAMAFVGGGTAVGPGTSKSDSIPVWLSAGEEVIQDPYESRNRGLLQSINAGDDPRSWLASMMGWGSLVPASYEGYSGYSSTGGSAAEPQVVQIELTTSGGAEKFVDIRINGALKVQERERHMTLVSGRSRYRKDQRAGPHRLQPCGPSPGCRGRSLFLSRFAFWIRDDREYARNPHRHMGTKFSIHDETNRAALLQELHALVDAIPKSEFDPCLHNASCSRIHYARHPGEGAATWTF